MSQVQREAATDFVVETRTGAYTFTYAGKVTFDGGAMRLYADSWLWLMLEMSLADPDASTLGDTYCRLVKRTLSFLCGFENFHEVLNARPSEIKAGDIRKLFSDADEKVVAGLFPTSQGARGMGHFRSLVLENAPFLEFSEPITHQTVRFSPTAKLWSSARPLLSDLREVDSNFPPLDAISFKAIPELKMKVSERALQDLTRIRAGCIRDLENGASMRARANDLFQETIKASVLDTVRPAMVEKHGHRRMERADLTARDQIIALLQIIDSDKLYRRVGSRGYSVVIDDEAKSLFFGGNQRWKSRLVFEIRHHATSEEVFAAFHLLHTYVGWNFSSVMQIDPSSIKFEGGFVTLQGYKSKTDDDTPLAEISLKEPGVEDAVNLLLWNRAVLLEQGHVSATSETLWCIAGNRKQANAASHSFHPQGRLDDFQSRHNLVHYSLEQIRNQALFIRALSRGGLEAAQVHAGHKDLKTTARYVSRIIEERLSSSVNFEFKRRLSDEIEYLFASKDDASSRRNVVLLRTLPVGDGATCASPTTPPPGRSKDSSMCDGERCHSEGGCPNRRTVIDDKRIEELVRAKKHYALRWQDSWQRNPDRFITYTLPGILYTETLYRIVAEGPYSWKLAQAERKVDKEMRGE